MLNASWMAQLVIGRLLSAAGFADDAKPSNTDGEPLPVVILSIKTLLAESQHASGWQLFHPASIRC